MKFLIYFFVEFAILCSHSLAWNHGDNFNMIMVNNSAFSKDVEKLPFVNVLDDLINKPKSCHKPSTCVPIKNNTCLGVKLAYTHTSLSLTGASNLDENLVSSIGVLKKFLQVKPNLHGFNAFELI